MESRTTKIPSDMPPPKPDLSFARRPQSKVAAYFWRWRMWFEATFVFSMLEPWEKLMLLIIICVTSSLLLTGIIKYLPHHLTLMQRRAVYYLWGQEDDVRLLWQWLGFGPSEIKDV